MEKYTSVFNESKEEIFEAKSDFNSFSSLEDAIKYVESEKYDDKAITDIVKELNKYGLSKYKGVIYIVDENGILD